MAYAILTMDKYHTFKQMAGLQKHNDRELPLPHIDASKTIQNQHLVQPGGTYMDAWKNRMNEAEIEFGHKPFSRRNSVLMIELVLSYSKEADIPVKEWAAANVNWLEEKFGKENILSCVLHMDESTPHIHADIIPINKEGNLSAKSIINGPNALKKLQTEYAAAMEPFGLMRGEKNTKSKKRSLKKFYEALNEIDNNPAPLQLPEETKDEYIDRLTDYIHTMKVAIYKLKLQTDRMDEVVDTRVSNAIHEYIFALNLYNQIMDNYDGDAYYTNGRLKKYLELEQSVPRHELDKVINFLQDKYPPKDSVLNYDYLRLFEDDEEETKNKKIKVQLLD